MSVSKRIGRTKLAMLETLNTDPSGKTKFAELDRLKLIALAKQRAKG